MNGNSLTTLMKTTSFVAAIALGLAVQASRAEALTPLPKEAHINASLMAAVVGDEIRKACPDITPRWFTVLAKGRELEDYARAKGYTEAEVKAFLKDKTEKTRVKAMAADYMAANGVVKGNVESYCALGRAEIEKKSLIGSLLRAR